MIYDNMPKNLAWVIACINHIFGNTRHQYVKLVVTTEYSFLLAEIGCISWLHIFKERFAKDCQQLILPLSCLYNYKYLSIVDIHLIGLKPEHHPVFQFQKKKFSFATLVSLNNKAAHWDIVKIISLICSNFAPLTLNSGSIFRLT